MFPKKCPVCTRDTLDYDERHIYCTNCPIYNIPLSNIQKPIAWAKNRQWWWRLPIYVWFMTILGQNLRDSSANANRLSNPFSIFDLGIHELGHVLFAPFGDFMHIVGGSLFQCLFPLLWLVGFLQKRWYFAASMCLCWLGINLFDVATYVADARARVLPLTIGLGIFGIDPTNTDEAYDQAHDWYQILSRTDLLSSDLVIARGFRIAGTVAFLSGLVLGGILLLQMLRGTIQKLSSNTPSDTNQTALK